MKFLVTGGLGFIGSNLVDKLVDLGHDVIVIDDLSTGKQDYMNPDEKVIYYIGKEHSILNLKLLLVITKGVDIIFHEAAWARVMRSVEDPVGTNNVNVTGTLNILEAARINKVKRVICASSSSVYGLQESAIMNESMELHPMHPYALQKVMLEQYCQLYSKLYDLNTVCLRYFNVYGPRQIIEGDYALVIGKFIRQFKEDGKLTIYGDGTQTRAYTHVVDVVRANIMAMEAVMPYRANWIFNVGGNVETSVNEIAKMLGGDEEYNITHITPNPRGNFEEKRKAADFSKIKEILGWTPKIGIEEGINYLTD